MSGVRGIPTRAEFLEEFKVTDPTMDPMPSFTTQRIFREMGAEPLNDKLMKVKNDVTTLRNLIEKAEDPTREKAYIVLRLLATVALIATVVLMAISLPELVVPPLLAYCIITKINVDEMDVFKHQSGPIPFISAPIVSPLLPIIELMEKWNNDPGKEYAEKKQVIMEQFKELGQDFEVQSEPLAKRISDQVECRQNNERRQYELALQELETCRQYYTQFIK